MSSESNVDLVRSFYAALHTLDLAAMFNVLDPNVQFHHPAAAPWGGNDQGHAGARRFLEQLVHSVDARFEVAETVEADDAGNTTVAGQLCGQARASGAPLDVRFVHTWTTHNGRLTGLDEHLDLAALLRALGGQERPVTASPWSAKVVPIGELLGAARREAGAVSLRNVLRQPALACQPSAGSHHPGSPVSAEGSDVYLSFRQAFAPASWHDDLTSRTPVGSR